MKPSIIDVINATPVWHSYGAVIIPPGEPRLGFFPCYGTTFTPGGNKDDPLPGPDYFRWDDKLGRIIKYSPKPRVRPFRSVKFSVKSPAAGDLLQIPDSDDLKDHFAPQAVLDDEFVRKFSALAFVEVGGEYLVGERPLMFTSTKDRKIPGIEIGVTVAVNFIIELAWEGATAAMVQRAYWSDGYVGTYGCCG